MTLTSKIRPWMILGRIHTSILEVPLAVLGAALGLGTLWDSRILLWIVFGMLYHYSGYGMNSYVDWRKGYDKNDPRKAHHPLNTGDILPSEAKMSIFVTLTLLIVWGEIISGFTLEAHISILIMLVSGLTYNYLGKEIKHKYLPIAVVHTMVFVMPFAVYSDQYTLPFILATLAIFVHQVFQIAISGDIKDLDRDESGILRDWGTEVKPGLNGEPIMVSPLKLSIYTFILVSLEIVLATSVAILLGGYNLHLVLVLIMGAIMSKQSSDLIEGGKFMREDRVTIMSRKELAGIWMICASFIPIIDFIGWVAIVLLSSLYLITTSKVMWGTLITPRV